jgi:hypothetical protein
VQRSDNGLPHRRIDRLVRGSTTSAPLIAAVVVALACTTDDEAAQVNATTALPTVVTVTATDYAFQAPDTIPAGFTTFRLVNSSDQIHMAHLIRLEAGRTVQELIEAYSEAVRTVGPRAQSFTEYAKSLQWATRFGGPGAGPHATSANVTQHLEPGTYAWICLMEVVSLFLCRS